MKSVCMSECINDVASGVPKRATYVNLYKWPESDAEFVRSVSSNSNAAKGSQLLYGNPTAWDSISSRQAFLRSYKFSRKQSIPEKTSKCFHRMKRKLNFWNKKRKVQFRRRKCLVWKKLKAVSCSALFGLLRRLLFSSARVHHFSLIDP